MPSPDVTTNTLLALTVLVSLFMANKLTLRHVRLRKKTEPAASRRRSPGLREVC